MSKRRRHENEQRLPGMDAPVCQMPRNSYSGDTLNRYLEDFLEHEGIGFDPDCDNYDVQAFRNPLNIANRRDALNDLHIYWSKKPYSAITQYIRHYTSVGDVVLDPFCGSGGTLLAALMENRKAVGIDRSPAATFISKSCCTPIHLPTLDEAYRHIERAVKSELEWLYETKCDRCGGRATTTYTVHSQVFQCPRCLEKIALFDCVETEGRTRTGKAKKVNACPYCMKAGHTEVIRSQSEKFGFMPVAVSYSCQSGCKPARSERTHCDLDVRRREFFDQYDAAKVRELETRDIPHSVPTGYDMSGFSRYKRDALYYYGVKEVADLFSRRSLWALAAIRDAISVLDDYAKAMMLFALSGTLWNASRMYQHREAGGGPAKGMYYVPQVCREVAVWTLFSQKVANLRRASEMWQPVQDKLSVAISTQSACDLSNVPSESIDYIFTDPPYAEKVQYGELNYVWEAWLGFDTSWHTEEIIVNLVRNKPETEWAAMMRLAMAECFRVMKPGRWLSLCYHDTSEGSWQLIQDVMAEVGFVIDKTDSAVFIDTGQKSYNQLTADKATKRDLVLNFRKPKAGEAATSHLSIPADADLRLFQEVGRQIIREYLTAHPGATKDRIYDELVSRMVRRGEMETHDFDSLLRSVAEEVQEPVKENLFENKKPDLFGSHVRSRWYLKETADQIDQGEEEKEDAAAERLEKFMATYLEKHLEQEGVHYSDLFEQVITIPASERPRRLFENWLPEYFFKTADGTWRPPDDEKERQQKAALRKAGTLRRMKRFANALIEGVPIRDKDRPDNDRTLAEWIRQCRRAGLYEQGRALYEKGGLGLAKLSDEEQIEVEDDYRLCVKRGKEDGKSKGK